MKKKPSKLNPHRTRAGRTVRQLCVVLDCDLLDMLDAYRDERIAAGDIHMSRAELVRSAVVGLLERKGLL